jgi:hypothetical protein
MAHDFTDYGGLGRGGAQSTARIEGSNDADLEKKVSHASGAQSSHKAPNYFLMTGCGRTPTALRFQYGNTKYEGDNTVYHEANWLKAYNAKDLGFFRDRAAHAVDHIWAEFRGEDDLAPGGNLGAIGWFQDIMSFVKEHDPYFYGAIQGKYKYEPDRPSQVYYDPNQIAAKELAEKEYFAQKIRKDRLQQDNPMPAVRSGNPKLGGRI